MTLEQFDKLFGLLTEINQNVKLITAKDTGKTIFGLSDVVSAVADVESAVKDIKSS